MTEKPYLKFKRYDLFIPAAAFITAALILFFSGMDIIAGNSGSTVVVTVAGEEYGRFPLSEDRDLIIPGDKGMDNHLVISKGEADIVDSRCPDKICVHQRKIRRKGETIVCLPNKVVIEITGDEESDIDAVSR